MSNKRAGICGARSGFLAGSGLEKSVVRQSRSLARRILDLARDASDQLGVLDCVGMALLALGASDIVFSLKMGPIPLILPIQPSHSLAMGSEVALGN